MAVPLYCKGEADLPEGSAVIVGYTVGAYKVDAPADVEVLPQMNWNIQWVVLLGLPTYVEEGA